MAELNSDPEIKQQLNSDPASKLYDSIKSKYMINNHIFDIIKRYFKISEDNSCLEFKSTADDQYIKKIVRILYYEDNWYIEYGIEKKYRLRNETVHGKTVKCTKVIDNNIFSSDEWENIVSVSSIGEMIRFLVNEVL